MKWEVSFISRQPDKDNPTVTVDGKNWMEALRAALSAIGEDGSKVKIISSSVHEDDTIIATEFYSKKSIKIKPRARVAKISTVPKGEAVSFLESRSSLSEKEIPSKIESQEVKSYYDRYGQLPPHAPPLLEHTIFRKRDENPKENEEGGLIYRERLIFAKGKIEKKDAEALLKFYYESLRKGTGQLKGNRYINLAIYDHEFEDKPKAPAIAALSWQDWKDHLPRIVFPAESYEKAAHVKKLTGSIQLPQKIDEEVQQPIQPPKVPKEKPQVPASPEVAEVEVKERPPITKPSPPPQKVEKQAPAQIPGSPAAESIPAPLAEKNYEILLAEVFEELQDMYMTQSQEEAAELVLNIAMKKIPVEAGTIFLADINTRDLIFAAVRGPSADKLKGQKLIMTKGLVGFAAREGVTIAISDVTKDPRFFKEFDQSGEFKTKSVMCAPVQYEGRTFGAIELLNKKGQEPFTQGEINIVSYLASQLAEFIAVSLPTGEEEESFEEKKKPKEQPKAAPAARAKRSRKKKPRKRKK